MGAVSRRCVGSAARRQASADPAVPRPVQHDVLLGVTTPSPQPSSRAPHTSAAAPSSAACCPPALLQSSPVSADLPHLLKPAKPLELNSAASTGGLAVSGGSPATSGPVLRRVRRSLPACLTACDACSLVWQQAGRCVEVTSPISPQGLPELDRVGIPTYPPIEKCEDLRQDWHAACRCPHLGGSAHPSLAARTGGGTCSFG